jgi:dTDP-4-dehydrorhamnose reductase
VRAEALRILVFGTTGQLAREFQRQPWPAGVEPRFLDRAAVDLAHPDAAAAAVADHRPDAVVIAAAYTAVDRAESEEALATAVNAEAPGAIAAAAARIGAPVVHLSTDYVFDGTKPEPYVEDDPIAPTGAYGRSKALGEARVRDANPHHLILRTAWVYSPFGTNFVRTMLRLAASRPEVGVVADQQGCPTAASELARAIVKLLPGLRDGGTRWGTYHAAGATATSWHGFAEAIFASLASRGLTRPLNRAIATADYPTPARRPANSRLASDRLVAAFGLRLAGFEESLPGVIDELLAPAAAEAGR